MRPDLLLFAHLLIFVTGTLLYGFLSRELFRNRHVLPGLPMRLTVVFLTVWYGGCLIDQVGRALVPSPDRLAEADALLDVVRGLAWMASFPLLTHGLWRLLELERRRPSALWLVPGYATLAVLVPVAWNAWRQGSIMLTEVARAAYPLVALHMGVTSAASAFMVLRWLRSSEDSRLNQFLRWLLAGLGISVALVIAGGLLLPGSPEPWDGAVSFGSALWRLLVEASGLVLGITFLYFVQRYNLLRLSMSYRSLRHFLVLLGVVGLVTLAGTVMGGGTAEMRRIVAWGVLAALLAAALYTPLQRAALGRFAWLRRLLGVSITAEELEALTRRLQSLDLPEEEMRGLAAREIGQWLATRARFLGPPSCPSSGSTSPIPKPGPSTGWTRPRAGSPPCSRAPTSRPCSPCGWRAIWWASWWWRSAPRPAATRRGTWRPSSSSCASSPSPSKSGGSWKPGCRPSAGWRSANA